MQTRDWRYGDEVTASDGAGGTVKGVIVHLDWGADDTVIAGAVRTPGGEVHAVDPATLAYQVDSNGFSFSYSRGELTIRRNDDRLLDPKWVRRKGIKLLRQSLRGKVR